MDRPYHVYDYDGEHLGSFATWDAAHDWAHLQAALGGVLGPLDVEDRRNRVGRRLWAERCEFTHWQQIGQDYDIDDIGSIHGCAMRSPAMLTLAPPQQRRPV
ncbi:MULTISPECIES: hypothetical protein [Protofrankia]|uniref:hypothetical protein n=1 Tax=Protofrankia TaxID=2994361 RepID=UPI000AE299A9|nr:MULTISPECIES: hypothetical protein [Protofrankia]